MASKRWQNRRRRQRLQPSLRRRLPGWMAWSIALWLGNGGGGSGSVSLAAELSSKLALKGINACEIIERRIGRQLA